MEGGKEKPVVLVLVLFVVVVVGREERVRGGKPVVFVLNIYICMYMDTFI